ncbi:MAG: DNA replication complex GINS family protein [Nanoarchaeota archaeon]|nr:DNA replication complex GINS family protein [Nanoarchaeota archaeon]
MSSEIITYSKIREYQREERTKPILVKLPDNAVELIQIYLKEKKTMLEKNKDDSNLFSQDVYSRIEYELKNAIRSIANIFEIREKKIIDKAFHTSKNDIKIKDTTNMLYFEKRLFTQLVELFNNYNENCIIAVLKNNKPVFDAVCSADNENEAGEHKVLKREETFLNKELGSDKILIRITSDVPSFQWEDDTKMGPFRVEDTVFVPKKLGTLLINQKKAIEVTKK